MHRDPRSSLVLFAILACSSDQSDRAVEMGIGPTTDAAVDGDATGADDDSATGGAADPSSDGESTGESPATDGDSDASTGESSPEPSAFRDCYAGGFVNGLDWAPDYDALPATIGTHCSGTDHQDIDAVDRVVFLGDSVTVGTPPTDAVDYYRVRTAQALAQRFGLSAGEHPWWWENVNLLEGTTWIPDDGDFSSCAHYGDRTEDMLGGSRQLEQCYPPERRNERTLTIMTAGGNDLAAIVRAASSGASTEDLEVMFQSAVTRMREAMLWLTDPDRFPAGHFVVFANIYEFTDGTARVLDCDIHSLAGIDNPVPVPDHLREHVRWANAQFLAIAIETGTDMAFLYETFCGHGLASDDPTAPCYRGPGVEQWFDLTCTHPTPHGHGVLADMVLAIVDE